MRLLAESASGLRHLRWAREVRATLEAHAQAHGSEDQRRAWREEAATLGAAIDALSAAVKAYRDFLERERVASRGALRVAAYLDDSERLRAESEAAGAIERDERAPRRQAVRQAVRALRAAIENLHRRCEEREGADFAASLYPPVTPDRQLVVDDSDEDDDATTS